MKKLMIWALAALTMLSLAATPFGHVLAQEPADPGNGGINLDVDIEDSDAGVWYGQWWVWAAGVAVFLIVIVALTNRGSGSRA
jgi:hypothetical protein